MAFQFLYFSLLGFCLSLPFLNRAKGEDSPTFRVYGFINANVSSANKALSSFGYTNLTAPTSIAPSSITFSNRARDSFQVGQSRIGFWSTQNRFTGRFESDFIDFTKSSPITQAVPRLRIANLDYQLDSSQVLSVGQDWDLFSSPLKPFTYNLVGLFFKAGNIGFMRIQVRYQLGLGSQSKIESAIGLLSANPTASDSETEMTGLPTFSLRFSQTLNSRTRLGMAALIGWVRPAPFPEDLRGIYGINTFFIYESDSKFGLQLRESFYYGQNLASSGALSLATASVSQGSRHELGGNLTLFKPLSRFFSTQLGLGAAAVLESGGSPFSSSLPDEGICSNFRGELSFAYHLEENTQFYIQRTFMRTHFRNRNTSQSEILNAVSLQLGALSRF